ncbi:hypothetical protein PINS_up001890 [Pythium insidiosum]|nr:hypothetical protein PINS_up001890 [Pythium insidiosum]
MASSSSWTATALTTAAALAVAVPLVYLKYQHSVKAQERHEALKLIRKVELIVGEVTVRLMHVENQVEDLLANETAASAAADSSSVDAPAEEETSSSSTLNSYYHFDSQGNKLKTKWDSYDVDAELEKLDQEDEPTSSAPAPAPKKKATPAAASMTRSKLLTALGGLEHEYEAVLEFLDGVRGDDVVRETRKALVTRVTTEHFARIDSLRSLLK